MRRTAQRLIARLIAPLERKSPARADSAQRVQMRLPIQRTATSQPGMSRSPGNRGRARDITARRRRRVKPVRAATACNEC
jgi:hypothetical protein